MIANICAFFIWLISFALICYINVTSSLNQGGHLLLTVISAIILVIGICIMKNADKIIEEDYSDFEVEKSKED